ncbi:hypothetical protein [Paraburkholderia guartelaensis]|uniref:hypothetical protein n=1 Tax=Paraburkholderia guartelaensis TaxID=2546446 RepID=UPI002AB62E9F|nr:hypothetical protein [Paraburkholderia guartelaensis]
MNHPSQTPVAFNDYVASLTQLASDAIRYSTVDDAALPTALHGALRHHAIV